MEKVESASGLLLFNKPIGITSFDCIRHLRRVTGIRKIGHAGTLDPLASGLMLILIEDACKRASVFSKLDKTYTATLALGAETITGDAEGEPQPISDRVPTLEEIEAALPHFSGEITQTPSAYSAIKIDGQEAYKRVRAGQAVVMPSRVVTVYSIEILDYKYPQLALKCHVSSGTYIRSLAQDLGRYLKTGAYLSGLERTGVGEYFLKEAVSIEQGDPELVLGALRNIP